MNPVGDNDLKSFLSLDHPSAPCAGSERRITASTADKVLSARLISLLALPVIPKDSPEASHWNTFLDRSLLKDIKSVGENHILLDCRTENIHEILTQAQQVGLLSAYKSLFITSLVKSCAFTSLTALQ